MFTFIRYLFLLSSLLSLVKPVPLTSRDVVDPPITSPTANTVWHVGQTQTVTWKTTGLPVNQTNPVGMLVLGYLFNNSENLMLDNPLAKNLNYSVGQAQITVPNVSTRSDYIIVLFGDSGNASPEFTIINDASSSTSAAPSPVPSTTPGSNPGSTTPPAAGPTPPSSPGPANSGPGGSGPGGSGGSSPTIVNGAAATPTTPGSQTTSHSSTVVVVTGSSTPSSTHSSAAWRKHAPSLGTSFSVALVVIYFAFS